MRTWNGTLAAFGTVLALMAAPATADTWNFNLSASVPAACSFSSTSATGAWASSSANAATGAGATYAPTVTFDNAINAAGILASAEAVWQVGLVCNAPSILTVSSQKGAMTPAAQLNSISGFRNHIPYWARVSWGGANADVQANQPNQTVSKQATVQQATNGTLQVRFEVQGGDNNALLGATYTDVLTVTVAPQV